jgi:hypothetical protein
MRREVLGAWRSVRYDLDHRSKADVESKANTGTGTPAGTGNRAGVGPVIGFDGASAPVTFGVPSVSSVPSGTFDGEADSWYGQPLPERESIWAPLREPRRVMAALAVASVIAASATGTFVAVTGGLGLLLADSSGAPAAPQTAPAGAPQVVTSRTPRHRQVPASHSPSPSPSASVRQSTTLAARPTGTVKPSPLAPATSASPSRRPEPDSGNSATASNSASPSVTPPAEPTP